MDNGAQYSESLARLRTRTIEQCLEAQRRSGRRLVFALDTALSLQGIELPRYRRGGLLADTLHAVIESNGVRTILQGICFVLWSGPQTHMPIHHGRLRCTDSVTAWAMHANRLEDEELVVLGDSMMRRDGHMKKATLEEFRIYVDSLSDLSNYSGSDRLRAVRGVSKMRRVLRLMRENTDSSQETRSRIVLLRYGLPCPEVNYAIRLKGYSHVFFADMAYPDLKIIIEYDGRHHASRWLADSKRREALEDEGWLYIQVTAENLRDEDSQKELAERVAQRMSLRLGEPVRLCGRMTIAQIADGRRKGNRL